MVCDRIGLSAYVGRTVTSDLCQCMLVYYAACIDFYRGSLARPYNYKSFCFRELGV